MNKKIKLKILKAREKKGKGRYGNSYSTYKRSYKWTGAKNVNLTKNAIVRLRKRLQKIKKQRHDNEINEIYLKDIEKYVSMNRKRFLKGNGK